MGQPRCMVGSMADFCLCLALVRKGWQFCRHRAPNQGPGWTGRVFPHSKQIQRAKEKPALWFRRVDPGVWKQAKDTSREITTSGHPPPGQSQEG